MTAPRRTARRLAATDIAAVLLFCLFAAGLWRALADSPFLQKERLTAGEAAADIDEFFRRVEKTHPGPGITPAAYAALKARAHAEASAGLDEFGRLEARALARILHRCAAGLGDSGTRVLWRTPRKWKDPEPRFPPFSLEYVRGRFLVRNAEDPRLNGGELLEAGGVPLDEFLRPALELVPAETAAHRAYLFCRHQDAWWDISGLFAGRKTVRIKARYSSGRTWTGDVGPVSAGEFRRLTLADPGGGSAFYPQKAEAVVRPGTMEYSWRARKDFRTVLGKLNSQGTNLLVLDLRDCPGGDRRMAEYMFSLLGGGRGERGFPGRTALLTGPGSGPAAAWLAARFRETGRGELLGGETGGTAGHYGSPRTFKLGASGIRFSVSSRYFAPPGADPGPVLPDLELTPARLAAARGDAALFALERLAQGRGPVPAGRQGISSVIQ